MSNLTQLLSALTPEQRQALAATLLASDNGTPAHALEDTSAAPPVATLESTASSYYNMDDAVAVTFKADLSVSDKSRDTSYARQYDHVWCKGNYRVKGPKGGVYFVGRCVLGVKKGQQVKGTLRVGNKHFEPFMNGSEMDAWFRPDGADDALLIGTLSNFRVV
jgi:hypothetical protein